MIILEVSSLVWAFRDVLGFLLCTRFGEGDNSPNRKVRGHGPSQEVKP